METSALFTLSLILFLSITTNGVSASRGISNIVDETPSVVDSDGNKLQRGQYYYLSPLIPLPRLYTAAIVPGIYRPGTVWLNLEIEIFTYGIKGLPVIFSPVEYTQDKTIHESTDLNIKYTDELSPLSGGSSVLQVGELGEGFLTLGGAEEDKKSWFRIERGRSDGVYKLVSSFYSGSNSVSIGISERHGGTQRLAPADREPLEFIFIPVSVEPRSPK